MICEKCKKDVYIPRCMMCESTKKTLNEWMRCEGCEKEHAEWLKNVDLKKNTAQVQIYKNA